MSEPDRFDKPPTNDEERNELLIAIRDQSSELYEQTDNFKSKIYVTCPCGRSTDIVQAHKCYHCGLYYCRRCCSRHFGPQPTQIEGS